MCAAAGGHRAQQYDQMIKYATAIRQGTASTEAILRRFTRRDQLALPSLNLSQLQFQPGPMIIGALLLFGGFLLFTGTLVAAGAIMPTAKEAGSIFGAMMVLLFVPFYALSLVVSDPTSPIVQIFTFFPYTAPFTAMLRNGLGSLPGSIQS